MLSNTYTDATAYVAHTLRAQFQGRGPLDWGDVATAAVEALFAYEESLNSQFLIDHPECDRNVSRYVDESVMRASISADISRLDNPYTGTHAVAFASAKRLAARAAVSDEV